MRQLSGKWLKIGAFVVGFGWLTLSPGWAHWRMPTHMPVARLLKNVQAYVLAHPKDAHGYYTLGRINSAAYAEDKKETEDLSVYTGDPLPYVPTYYSHVFPARTNPAAPLSPQSATYLTEALRNYEKATSLDSTDSVAWLGLGFQCEQAIPFPQTAAKAGGAFAPPKPLDAEGLRLLALQYDRKAYALSVKADTTQSLGVSSPVSMEAAEGIVRLQAKHTLSSTEQIEVEEMKKQIEQFKKRPRAITPILISFERQATLANMLAPQKHVHFDLAGDGLRREWPWVKPTTGILVWDPEHTGKITSGIQLFGSVTWWLFWKDGYEPLAALDNNHSGWLEGAELQGIAVWFDRNGNGITDQGEVVSLSSLGIKRIATHSAGMSDGVPANPEGIQLRDGSSLATFDWTPTSLKHP